MRAVHDDVHTPVVTDGDEAITRERALGTPRDLCGERGGSVLTVCTSAVEGWTDRRGG